MVCWSFCSSSSCLNNSRLRSSSFSIAFVSSFIFSSISAILSLSTFSSIFCNSSYIFFMSSVITLLKSSSNCCCFSIISWGNSLYWFSCRLFSLFSICTSLTWSCNDFCLSNNCCKVCFSCQPTSFLSTIFFCISSTCFCKFCDCLITDSILSFMSSFFFSVIFSISSSVGILKTLISERVDLLLFTPSLSQISK